MNGILSVITFRSIPRYALVAVPILLACLLSPTALIILGMDYVVPGGNAFAKVHPATYCAVISLIIFMSTGSLSKIRDIVFREKYALIYYIVCLVLLFSYAAVFLSVPFMQLIDVWVLSCICVILISLLTLGEKWMVARTIDAFMIANSSLGFLETGTNWRMVPITQWSSVLGQWVYPYEWRATAFLGHPLTNSYVVGAYILCLILTKRISQLWIKLPLIFFHALALSIFGSRAAAVFLGAGFLIYILVDLARMMLTGRINKDILVYTTVIVPTIVVIIPLVLSSGIADRYLERFVNDGGSAETRNVAIELVAEFPIKDIVFGVPSTLLIPTLKRYNLIALESFWLNFLMIFGIVGCVIFFPAMFRFCQYICSKTNDRIKYVFIYFFLCCSTSQSIGSKSGLMAIIVSVCMTSVDYSSLWVRKAARQRSVGFDGQTSDRGLVTVAPGGELRLSSQVNHM